MSLIQRNVVPLFVMLALAAVAVVVWASTSSSPALGEEPAGCDVSNVGISVITTNASGESQRQWKHGEVIQYQVILSIPELPGDDIPCNYSGGSLAMTLPNGEVYVLPEDIPVVSRGNPFAAGVVSYTVNQKDAIERELDATVDYTGGTSYSAPEGERNPSVSSSITHTVRMAAPSIDVTVSPSNAAIYLGQQVDFEIRIANTGGFWLSNVTLSAAEAIRCDREVPVLAVNGVDVVNCSLVPADDVTLDFVARGIATGGVIPGESPVSDVARAIIDVDEVAIRLTMLPVEEYVRSGENATFTFTVDFSEIADLTNVILEFPQAPHCDIPIGSVSAGADPVEGSCSVVLTEVGENVLHGNVSGRVPGLVNRVVDTGEASFLVFDVELLVTAMPKEQIVREGGIATFEIRVLNNTNSELTNVQIENDAGFGDCRRLIGNMDPNESWPPADEDPFMCDSNPIMEDTIMTVTASAIARDDKPVSNTDTAEVRILRPSTSIMVTDVDTSTTVMRLVVQTSKITETNDGDSPLTDVWIEVSSPSQRRDAVVRRYHRESPEFVGGDYGEQGVMEVGETWEWRVITVALAGDYVALSADEMNLTVRAIGHGMDLLGADVTFPGDADELSQINIPILGP